MDRLPEPLATFREHVEADMRRAARLIIKVQDEIDPQWRIATGEGDYAITVTLPGDPYERKLMMRRLSTFMAWKGALSFIVASELVEPDCVYALGVSAREVHACLSPIRRSPKPWTAANFGPVEWLDKGQIGSELLDLLPSGPRPLTPKEVSALQPWFGVDGKFPAVHVPSSEIRGL